MKATKKDIGRKVKFRPLTRWTGAKQDRIIKNVLDDGRITVRFGGWAEFVVRSDEIIEIYGLNKKGERRDEI